jgi:beta-galactosidase
MVSIASYWTHDSPGPVRVFSNAEEVELLLNGQLISRQRPDDGPFSSHLAHPPFTFPITGFLSGELVANAYIRNTRVASDIVSTPGPVNRLVLGVDDSGVPVSDNDAVFIRAFLVDDIGTRVTSHEGEVTFSIDCPANEAWLVHTPEVEIKAGGASALLRIVANPRACQISATHADMQDSISLANQGGKF